MPTTTTGLPYPALTDTPDVPYWMQQLAEAVEARGLSATPRCKITANPAGQSIPNSALTQVDLAGGTVVYDYATAMADIANDQIVCKKAGLYILSARVGWASGSVGFRGAIITRGASDFLSDSYVAPVTGQATIQTWSSEPVQLALNDTINLKVIHTQGAALALGVFNSRNAHLALHWVGGQ